MEESTIRLMLVDIVEKGNFPSDTFEIRHIEKIHTFNIVSSNRVQFWVERHPHIFGKPTLGIASSAFITKYYLYELNTETKTVQLIKKNKGDPVVNISMLADESVSDFFDFGDLSQYNTQFEKINSEKEVIEFAIKEIDGNKSWEEEAEMKADELPEIPGFKEEYYAELKRHFVNSMVRHWGFYKEYVNKG